MKKLKFFMLASVLMWGVGNQSVHANPESNQDLHSFDQKKSMSNAEKTMILNEITSPQLDVQVTKKDGTVVNRLDYFVQNVDTGEILDKGETTNGKINSKITISQMIKEAANKKGGDINYTDFVLRTYNNNEEVSSSYFFSVPVFNTENTFSTSINENELIDLLWIHNSHFKNTINSNALHTYGYDTADEGLTITLNTKDDISSDVDNRQDFNASATCSLQSSTNSRTSMGRVTGNQNLSSELTIESGGNLKIDSKVDGVLSGSVTKSVSSTFKTPHAPTSPNSRIVYGTYKYGKYLCQDRYVYPYVWEEVRAISFEAPDGSSLVTGIDGGTPSGTIGSLTAGQSYSYVVSNGFRFGVGTTVHGVTLGTEVAYSSKHNIKFTSKGKGAKIFDNGTGKKVWYSTPIN